MSQMPSPPVPLESDGEAGYASGGLPVLCCGDDVVRRDHVAAIAEMRGLRVVAPASLGDAQARIAMLAAGVVILDLGGADASAIDGVLDTLERVSASLGSVVLLPEAMIDTVARLLDERSARLLVEPSDREIDEAIDSLLAPRELVLADSANEMDGRRLRQLSEEVGRIARTLATLSAGADAVPAPVEQRGAAVRLRTARAEIRLRRLREQYFERALFADPAWDMLLDLSAAEHERRRVAVSSLCIAASVPPTTALRWIAQMTEQGLLARYPDPDDGRRVFIALTEWASASMNRYLEAAAAARIG